MKRIKSKLFFVMVLFAFCISHIPAMAENTNFAVVDVNKVVEESRQVKALKSEQQAKLQELQKWLTTVKADVEKQQTKEGKEKLIKKYDADFAKKQEAIKNNYAEKLSAIDKSISAVIAKEAKARGYKAVVPKSSLLYYECEDLTPIIIKAVK